MYLLLAVAIVRRRVVPVGWPVAIAGVAFLAALAASIVLAGAAGSAWLRLAAYAPFVLLPWALPLAVGDEDGVRLIVRAWLAGAAAAIALGLLQILAFYLARGVGSDLFPCNYGRIPEGPYPRICGPFRNPNAFADYLAATAPIAILFAKDAIPTRWRGIAAAAFAVVSAFTLSSGIGGIALAAALAGAVLVGSRRRLLLAAGALVAAGFLIASVGYRVPAGLGQVPFPGGEWHFLKGPRVHTWLSVVGTVLDDPLTGAGYGATVAHTPNVRRWARQGFAEPLHIDRPPRKDAHEVWLSVAGQAGLIGLGAFLVLLFVCVRGLGSSLSRGPPRSRVDRLAAAAAAGLVGTIAFHGLFASVEESRHVWALLGLGVLALRLRERSRA